MDRLKRNLSVKAMRTRSISKQDSEIFTADNDEVPSSSLLLSLSLSLFLPFLFFPFFFSFLSFPCLFLFLFFSFLSSFPSFFSFLPCLVSSLSTTDFSPRVPPTIPSSLFNSFSFPKFLSKYSRKMCCS